jgi:predicted amidophosphoribosyltransferase
MQVAERTEIAGKTCIVVDDVATTGATLLEAERALKRAGAKKVYTLALARS